jgi:hypothetical protein
MKPTRGILDPTFKYVPSDQSNIRLTFMRERRRLKREAEAVAAHSNVKPIKKREA